MHTYPSPKVFQRSIGKWGGSLYGEFTQFFSRSFGLLEKTRFVSQRGGGEGFRIQSQEGQDFFPVADTDHLIFKTSTEEHTVDLTNKVMTKDSQRFSSWFHSGWRTTGPIL